MFKRREFCSDSIDRKPMMDSPFFRSHYYQPSRPHYSPSVRGIPVKSVRQNPTTTASAKVVSIPVHFVGSETTRSASALKIQKVFRGFEVRRSVKKIVSIKSEVDEIERRISVSETAELIQRDEKERLRLNEALMALLFKLDSIRGVDSGVRDCRRAVIKKAIALQEKIDSIVAASDKTLGTEINDQVVEVKVKVDDHSESLDEAVDQSLEIKDSAENVAADQTRDKALGAKAPEFKDSSDLSISDNYSENAGDGNPGESVPEIGKSEAREGGVDKPAEGCEKMEVTEIGIHSEVKPNEDDCVVKEIVENCNSIPFESECVEETNLTRDYLESSVHPQSLSEEGEKNKSSEKVADGMAMQRAEQTEVGGGDDNKMNRELLERMVEDNGKMVSLMMQLYARNEMQTRMLNSLTHRVEQLEKAFIRDRLRRKKKSHAA
ncbi:unnamed protein product [Ilex paraguariensis]|uniref:BAG domain-containing protein n=1 Tax=Ilex paraguariensis TaxID=185542 RepID=A0ABC8RIE3_9AQUA